MKQTTVDYGSSGVAIVASMLAKQMKEKTIIYRKNRPNDQVLSILDSSVLQLTLNKTL